MSTGAAGPGWATELHTMSSDEQVEALRAGRIDMGIGRAAADARDVEATLVMHEPLLVAVGSSHQLASASQARLRDLAGESIIGFDRRVSPSLHAVLAGMLGAEGVTYDPIIEATEYATILGFVAAGEGIAIVPASVQTFRPPDLHYVTLREPLGVSPAAAAHPLRRGPTPGSPSPGRRRRALHRELSGGLWFPLWFADDEGDVAVGAGLVVVVLGPMAHRNGPEFGLLGGRIRAGSQPVHLAPVLDGHLGVVHQVQIPVRVAGATTHGGDQEISLAVMDADERRPAQAAGLAPRRW